MHKPGKVLAELGRRNVYALTKAKPTVLVCVSASGFFIPPLIIYPQKQRIPDHMKKGAIPNTMFEVSESGWINQDIGLKWFEFLSTIYLLLGSFSLSKMDMDLTYRSSLLRKRGLMTSICCVSQHTPHTCCSLWMLVCSSRSKPISTKCVRVYMR